MKEESVLILRALKIFLAGLIVWPVFMSTASLVAPFVGHFVIGDIEKSLDWLRIFQPYMPFLSIVFSVSFLMLNKVDKRLWLTIISWLVVAIYLGSSIYGLYPDDSVYYIVFNEMSFCMEIAMLFLSSLVFMKIFSRLAEEKDEKTGQSINASS